MLRLSAKPQNPAQFLGACGFLHIASHLAPEILAHWDAQGLVIEADAGLFQDTDTLLRRLSVECAAPDSPTAPFELKDAGTDWRIIMDWWRDPETGDNSAWKCFAGNQKANKIARDPHRRHRPDGACDPRDPAGAQRAHGRAVRLRPVIELECAGRRRFPRRS